MKNAGAANADDVTDFVLTDDVLNISFILDGHYDASTNTLSDFVTLVNTGDDVEIYVDDTGNSGTSSSELTATLLDVNVTLGDLTEGTNLITEVV